MAAYYGSIRYWLQRAAQIKQPQDFRPFNMKWKPRRDHIQHDLRQYIVELRHCAAELEAWLEGDSE